MRFGSKTATAGRSPWSAAIGLALSLATLAVVVTGAIFTGESAVGSNKLTTGNVDISTGGASAVLTAGNMAPGDSTSGTVTVTNSGSLEMRYAVKSTTTEDTLAAQLELTVWDEAEEADAGTDCAATAPTTKLYTSSAFGSVAGTKVVGDSAQGAQTGDQVLAASANQVLCFQVALPVSTGNTYESLTTTATFDFLAEQTVNNA